MDVVRARVNGRSYSFDRDSGRVLKGPKVTVGKYIAANQLERIEHSDGYYGHLFLADSPENRRLEEAAFALMEYREEHGVVTLIEGTFIHFNGQSARVGEMDDKRVRLHFGNMDRLYSRERVEREATTDYVAMTEAENGGHSMFPADGPHLIDPIDNVREQEQSFEGSVEIDTDELADKVLAKMTEGDLLDTLAAKIADRLGTTSGATGEQQAKATEAE
jgi:hypothetical protein